MATSWPNGLMPDLRRLALAHDGAGLTDAELLGHYVADRDEAAFAVLVRRHASMVWGVCHRLLAHHQDAEDAFQATFLVLACKAAKVKPREMLPNWLYGVAYNTALKARAQATKRRKWERQVTVMPERHAPDPEPWLDLQPVLDHELSRLPDKYRVAVVLCDLEGKTRKEAARQLGCPEGTVATHVTRGREVLRQRLSKHGVTLSGAALATALSQQVASAAVPAGLLKATLQAAGLYASGAAMAGTALSGATLAQGVLKSMYLTKAAAWTGLLGLVAVAGLAGAGLWPIVSRHNQPEVEQLARAAGQPPAVSSSGSAQKNRPESDLERRRREARHAQKLDLRPHFRVRDSGEIRQPGERFWYEVRAARDSWLKVCQGTTGSSLHPNVSVYDGSFRPIASAVAIPGENAQVILTADEDRTYFLEIAGARDTTGDYLLLVSQPTPPLDEFPGSMTTRDQAGLVTFKDGERVITGAIRPVGDKDWFTFTPERSGQLVIEADTPESSLDTHLELHDAGKLLTQGHGQREDRLRWPVKAGERYWLLMRAGSEKGADDLLPKELPTGGYVVRIRVEENKR